MSDLKTRLEWKEGDLTTAGESSELTEEDREILERMKSTMSPGKQKLLDAMDKINKGSEK